MSEALKRIFKYRPIDIDRVHQVIAGEVVGRRCGRTMAMLVMALAQADFLRYGRILVRCHTADSSWLLSQRLIEVAYRLGFGSVKRTGRRRVLVNTTLYRFTYPGDRINIEGFDKFCEDHEVPENLSLGFGKITGCA